MSGEHVFILALVTLVFFFTIVTRIMRELFGRRNSAPNTQQQATNLDQMWRTMDRMEERIANLETILMQKEGSQRQIPPPIPPQADYRYEKVG